MSDQVRLAPARREQLPEGVLCADGFDGALLGSAQRAGVEIAVYHRERCIEILRRDFASSCTELSCTTDASECDHWLEAEEYFSYNTERGSEYLGEKGPLFLSRLCTLCSEDLGSCSCPAVDA